MIDPKPRVISIRDTPARGSDKIGLSSEDNASQHDARRMYRYSRLTNPNQSYLEQQHKAMRTVEDSNQRKARRVVDVQDSQNPTSPSLGAPPSQSHLS